MWIKHVQTHAICIFGAVVFVSLHLPLPWLFGPLFSCLIAALCGQHLISVKPVSDGMRTILGVAVGATITTAFIASLPGLWTTLVFIPISVFFIGWIGVWYFQKYAGYDFPTAYYAAMPGGLQDMIAFGEEAGGNVRAMSLIHATRVLVIVVLLPIILVAAWDIDLTRPPGAAMATFAWDQLALLTASALVGWRVAKALGMFGSSILGPLIMAAGCSLAGLLHTRPPAEAIWAAQYFIALGIGVKYVGITPKELRHDVAAGVGFCVILLILSAGLIATVIVLNLAPNLEAILSLAPGGQAELVVLAIIVGADMGFVVAHHVFRIFVVIIGAPVMARWFTPKPLD